MYNRLESYIQSNNVLINNLHCFKPVNSTTMAMRDMVKVSESIDYHMVNRGIFIYLSQKNFILSITVYCWVKLITMVSEDIQYYGLMITKQTENDACFFNNATSRMNLITYSLSVQY